MLARAALMTSTALFVFSGAATITMVGAVGLGLCLYAAAGLSFAKFLNRLGSSLSSDVDDTFAPMGAGAVGVDCAPSAPVSLTTRDVYSPVQPGVACLVGDDGSGHCTLPRLVAPARQSILHSRPQAVTLMRIAGAETRFPPRRGTFA